MAEFEEWSKADVHILEAGSRRNADGSRLGMGFLIGPHHVLTCAHVVTASLGYGEEWIGRLDPPTRPVTLALAFSSEHPAPIEATIADWWPEYDDVENRETLDDVALLRLADDFVLPGDVEVARRGVRPYPDLRVHANGVSADEQNGVSLAGWVRGAFAGNRFSIRTEGGDGNIVQGYSGAAVVASAGVIGMIAEKQQNQTGLFISIEKLLKAEPISEAWQRPAAAISFVGAMAPKHGSLAQGVMTLDEWLSMPIGARLARHLPYCDRVDAYAAIQDVALASSGRHPTIAVFGCEDDDFPEALYDRVQCQFLIEAGHAEETVAYPPPPWELMTMPWRRSHEPIERVLAAMKKRLVRGLGADGPEPAKIRQALGAGKSRAFYSEVDVSLLGPDDARLMAAWSAYLSEIGTGGLSRSLVHLLCVKASSIGSQADVRKVQAKVFKLASAGTDEVVVDLGLLPPLRTEDLERWLYSVARRVPLEWAQVHDLGTRFASEFSSGGRLRQVERWLANYGRSDEELR